MRILCSRTSTLVLRSLFFGTIYLLRIETSNREDAISRPDLLCFIGRMIAVSLQLLQMAVRSYCDFELIKSYTTGVKGSHNLSFVISLEKRVNVCKLKVHVCSLGA